MLRGGIEDFLKWDYVGAPWDLRDNDRVKVSHNTFELKVKDY